MTVYINFSNKEVISETKANSIIYDMFKYYLANDKIFEEYWLDNSKTFLETLDFSQEEQAEAKRKFKDYCYKIATADFNDEWEKIEMED